MKRLILCVSIFLLFICDVCAVTLKPTDLDKYFQFQFIGQWLPNIEPIHVGAQNYTSLENLRYTDTGLKTIEGFSKITSNALANATVYNGFHFRKEGESHFITKAYSSSDSNYHLYENTTAIPSTGDFTATPITDTDHGDIDLASGIGSFAYGPAGTMLYADDDYTLIWGGDAIKIGSFLSADDASINTSYDFTEFVNNDLTSEYAVIDTNYSTYLKLLLHMDGTDGSTNVIDSSPEGHTVTVSGSTGEIENDQSKWDESLEMDAATDGLEVPDSADWNFGTGNFTIDFWVYVENPSTVRSGYGFYQYDDSDNYIQLIPSVESGGHQVTFEVKNATATIISLSYLDSGSSIFDGAWCHIAVVRGWSGNANDWALVINGTAQDTDTQSGTMPDLADDPQIGFFDDTYIDEYRITKGEALWTANFTVPSVAYEYGGVYTLIGSPLKLESIYFGVQTANTISGTLAMTTWTGGEWSSISTTDGTASGGVPFAQSGTVEFGADAVDAKLMYLNGKVLYWYKFGSTNDITAHIYKVTGKAPIQSIRDVWNGSGRTCTSFQADRSNAYEDYTYRINEKSTEDAPYAATIGGLTSSDEIYLMFDDRVMGFEFTMLESLVNAADAQVSNISYWNGGHYIPVEYFIDKTLDAASDTSFSKSGVISWSPVDIDNEKPKEDFGKYGYVYKIEIDGTLTDGTGHDGTSVDYVIGIAAPVKTTGYDKVGFYAGRAMLITENRVDYSLPDYPWIFNGVNTSDDGNYSLYFGDDNPITASVSLYNRYGSSLLESWVVTKQGETYLLTGSQPYADYDEPFVIKTVSQNIGCPAPMTMKGVEIGFEMGAAVKRNALIWLDSSGPIIFDGTALAPIPGIENYFDSQNSECIKYSLIENSTAYYDSVHYEYNLIFPSGASATKNNTWLVYSLKHKKWYKKDVTEGGSLSDPIFTVTVKDANGGKYNYGMDSREHLLRLDNGQTWDSVTIAQEIITGEFSPPINDPLGFWSYSQLTGLKLVSDAISEDQDVTITPYADGSASSQTITVALDASETVSRNIFYDKSLSINGYLFQVKFTASSSTDKWEPLAWGYKVKYLRED